MASGEKLATAAIAPNTLMADLRISPSHGPIIGMSEGRTISPFRCAFVCGNAVLSPSLSAFVSAALEAMFRRARLQAHASAKSVQFRQTGDPDRRHAG
jgi:hypothetical protein